MRLKAALAAAFVVVMGAAAVTQTVDDFDAWMQAIDEKNRSVQQAIGRKDAAATAADAKALQASFVLVERFWTAREEGKDAVALSREARERAEAIEKASGAGDFDRAAAESIKLAGTCTPCHRMHRPLP